MLADCNGRMNWPNRGIYFFCEAGEARSRSGAGLRVVRVGTHGLKAGSRSTLWARLSQHRGTARASSGNHRGSIFRLLVGIALAKQHGIDLPPSWGGGGDPGEAARRLGLDRAGVKLAEAELEARVSHHIRAMPFLRLNVGDEPGPRSECGTIERNAIALLSGYREPALDPPSAGWLGHSSDRCRVRRDHLPRELSAESRAGAPALEGPGEGRCRRFLRPQRPRYRAAGREGCRKVRRHQVRAGMTRQPGEVFTDGGRRVADANDTRRA